MGTYSFVFIFSVAQTENYTAPIQFNILDKCVHVCIIDNCKIERLLSLVNTSNDAYNYIVYVNKRICQIILPLCIWI
jgi:hypothetical protein